MKKPFFLIFANAMILIVVFALLTQALFVVQRVASTQEVQGQVEVQRGGRGVFAAIEKKSFIKTNDVLRSGPDGTAEFKWADGTRLRITPNTQLTVKKASSNTFKKAENTQFKLDSGKVFVRIVKALTPSSKFEIETPTAVAAVRGTIFSVEVDKKGKTQVAVYKGAVKVSSDGAQADAEKMIKPGEVALSEQAGAVQTQASAVANSEFESQPSIVKPELSANVRPLRGGKEALIAGRSEAGDTVTINGEKAKVRGNGSFMRRVPLQPGVNTFTIVTTDKHGATNTVVKTYDPATATAPAADSGEAVPAS